MNTPRITRRRVGILAPATLCSSLVGGHLAADAHSTHASIPKPRPTAAQRTVVREATRRFRNVAAAIAAAIAAGYLQTDACAELPGVGGMGYHFVNPVLSSDGRIDPTQPEILLYTKDSKGRWNLAGVEWFMADGDQDLGTDADRPTLFSHPFDGPMTGHEPGMPVHFDLHVWLYMLNPGGQLSAWNPRLHCPTP